MTENKGVDSPGSITYYDEDLPVMDTGRAKWVMSV